MQCVLAPPAGPPMKAFSLPFVPAALRLGYFSFKRSIKLACGESLAVTADGSMLEPKVDPDCT